jgi:hypothetical protein
MPNRRSKPRRQFKLTDGTTIPLHTADVCLLSLDRCRALLPANCELSDAALEQLRDGLYALAGVTVDGYLAQPLAMGHTTALVALEIPGMRHEQAEILEFPDGKGER